MKKLIAVLLLAFSSVVSAADQVKSAYIQLERNVKIVITNQPCEKYKAVNVQLGFAYTINTDTGDTVTGCFAHDDKFIYIELSDEENKNHYTYKFSAERFQPSETL
jgi:hypothetical protein